MLLPLSLIINWKSLKLLLPNPLFIVSILFYDWEQVLIVFGIRFLIQGIILFKVTKKLDEKDLFPLYLILDVWMLYNCCTCKAECVYLYISAAAHVYVCLCIKR